MLCLLPSTSALVTVNLNLLVDARSKLVPYDSHAATLADRACHNIPLATSTRAVALVANSFPVDGELSKGLDKLSASIPQHLTKSATHAHGVALVNCLQINLNLGQHVLTTTLLLSTVSTERVSEHIERVVEASALLLLLEPFLAVSVVGLALLRIRESFESFRDLEELVLG